MNNFEQIKRRAYIYQSTDDKALNKILEGKICFYAGFDPTADSLHVGHLLPIMLMRMLVKYGHTAIVLVGGGTAMIGDPSGKKEARRMLDLETVSKNANLIKKQLSSLINDEEKTIFVDNSEWLCQMKMIDYLRELGSRFSVNKMLTAESVKQRLESGISYLEFSYMILQAYDFLVLNEKYNCILQIGGQDQWGNIVAGTDLIRRFKSIQAYGITVPLLLAPNGEKFGKTADGAVWISPEKTSDFDYYQFWRNVSDCDCAKLLRLFTDLPDCEIDDLEKLQPPELNRAKEILAFECTRIARGHDAAVKSYLAAGNKFGFADPQLKIKTSSTITTINPATAQNSSNLPVAKIAINQNENELWIVKLFTESGLCSSSGEARRLIQGGGAYLNGQKISNVNLKIPSSELENKETIIAAGKKNFKKIIFERS